ncbi:erythromycin esterase family protein [Roseisolibacter sp. H3M3-2]|uniref:erythromycin esterase family protein n=1 Tax=Roseisolibacter sp. H3M3-2 TaxID=3031323 RepID=UPI0023DA5FCB|nr:erythromycin esterase family protein [Roseisolibacter sp. H3M3-2]MDF1502942.1 erythromycin esterase family protein [Roseisolibacter sp. H3M3-2]
MTTRAARLGPPPGTPTGGPRIPRRLRRALTTALRATGALLLLLAACRDAAAPDEQTSPGATTPRARVGVPDGWALWGGSTTEYQAGLDSGGARSGDWSATIRSMDASPGAAFLALAQQLDAAPWLGRRVRLRGWVRTNAMDGGGARLWLRVDGAGTTLALDNMQGRGVLGTSDWRQLEIVADVPEHAVSIIAGPMVSGAGWAWFDDFTIEAVGDDVPTTVTAPAPAPIDSAALAAARASAARLARAFASPGFEPIPPVDPAAVAWLKSAAAPLAGSAPSLARGDLAALDAAVGGARLVGLGEGTHGTREHFQLKHRFVEHLVRARGFTAFAIEATMPEAEAVDRWVRGGPGDPAVLLSNLYFWTWNTEEVLALVRWMREYNATVPADRQVRFFGFDMQSPGAAIDSVAAYVRRVDPARAAAVDSGYACLESSRNRNERPGPVRYALVSAGERAQCSAAVARVHASLLARRDAYAAATSPEAFALALQYARLVVQWEDMAGRADVVSSSQARDRYMAENTAWHLGRLPAGARMALWAHNYHVSAVPGAQGAHLRARFGADYVIVGFSFGTGRLSAVRFTNGTAMGLSTMETAYVAPGSWEAHAQATALPYFLVDMRRAASAPDAQALAGAVPMRSIGSGFDPGRPELYFTRASPAVDYDVLVHVAQATASRLLPFRYR